MILSAKPYNLADRSKTYGKNSEIPYTAQRELFFSRCPSAMAKVRTRGDDRHVNQDVHVHLPVGDRFPDMAYLEVLFLANRRVVVFWTDKKYQCTCARRAGTKDALLRWMTYARSSGVRNAAVCGKSTRTTDSFVLNAVGKNVC